MRVLLNWSTQKNFHVFSNYVVDQREIERYLQMLFSFVYCSFIASRAVKNE